VTRSLPGPRSLAADILVVTELGEHRVVKDMTISHAEFFRIVPRLLDNARHELRPDGLTIYRLDGSIEIRLGPESSRSLGAIRLPRTSVELVFRHCAPGAIEAFITDFDHRFRRGGG
jgi:hypothetical protein